jgi:hypothetical protein
MQAINEIKQIANAIGDLIPSSKAKRNKSRRANLKNKKKQMQAMTQPVRTGKKKKAKRNKAKKQFGQGFANKANNWITVSMKETVCEVFAHTFYTAQSFPINPGFEHIFDWVSKVADAYEYFYIASAVFKFVSLANPIFDELASGQSGMLLDYDVKDAAPANIIELEDNPNSRTFRPIETRPDLCNLSMITGGPRVGPTEHATGNLKYSKFYTLSSFAEVAPDDDIHDYIPANLIIASEGYPTDFEGARIGKIVAEITWQFKVPKTDLPSSQNSVTAYKLLGVGSSTPLGNSIDARFTSLGSELFFSINQLADTIRFQSAVPLGTCWLITWELTASSGAMTFPAMSIDTTYLELLPVYTDPTSNFLSNNAHAPNSGTASQTLCVRQALVRVIDSIPIGVSADCTFSGGSWTGTGTATLSIVSYDKFVAAGMAGETVNRSHAFKAQASRKHRSKMLSAARDQKDEITSLKKTLALLQLQVASLLTSNNVPTPEVESDWE